MRGLVWIASLVLLATLAVPAGAAGKAAAKPAHRTAKPVPPAERPTARPERVQGSPQERADQFLAIVNAGYRALLTVNQNAQWDAATDVSPAHDAASETAGKAQAAFLGNPAIINEAKDLLTHATALDPLTVRELRRVLLNAAEGPMTNPELVSARIEAETKQASTMNGFTFHLAGRAISANEIDDQLVKLTDARQRLAVWEASKQSGPALRPGLEKLQGLRNGVARELGYPDYYSLQVARYDMTTDEMLKLNDGFLRELKPLYLQIHTWAKYELAKRYHQKVPDRIPAHWLPNRWGQEWEAMLPSTSLDAAFKGKSAEWVVKSAEHYYVSLGLQPLPASFWQRSDLYPVRATDTRKKNTHASCWHVDLEHDIRSLMSVEPNMEWFMTAHHELGHAYYFMSYTRPDVPYLLRDGANPSFHEGIGELGALAATQEPYLQSVGLLPKDAKRDEIQPLLNDALYAVPFVVWASGTMTHWEADLYAKELPPAQWNARWWQYVRDFQGIDPPSPRDERFCDAATKTHINDTPAYYHAYAIATVLKFQLHDYIARKILHQDPHHCSYAGHPEVGAFLDGFMRRGATRDWRQLLRETTGEDLSTRAMAEYFQPLMGWLAEQNRGRKIGWE
jgi:peptidyl-dipeptidase A